MLEDLASWTDLNTIELSNFFLDWGEADSWEDPSPPAPLALPATAQFSDLPVPVLDEGGQLTGIGGRAKSLEGLGGELADLGDVSRRERGLAGAQPAPGVVPAAGSAGCAGE